MVLMERDGITVQARSVQEEAEYKRLGFVKVETSEPAKKLTAAEKKAAAEKDGEE
jgi:hypothetical protein